MRVHDSPLITTGVFALLAISCPAHAIARNHAQLGAVLEEHIARALRRVDPDALVGDDGACGRRYVELRVSGSVSMGGRRERGKA
jgi:hypothetical protein